MENKKLSEMSNEELLKNEKKMKGISLTFAGILFLTFLIIIFSMIKKGFSTLVVVPIALLPILIVLLNNWNGLKAQIKSRSLK